MNDRPKDHTIDTETLRANLAPPGIVVNTLKGDPHEQRAHGWLEWNGDFDLAAAVLGVPFDGASTVRSGSRHGPDAVRQALGFYTTYSDDERRTIGHIRAADIGDLKVVVTDMAGTFARLRETICALVRRGIMPVSIGGDHSITWPILEGVCDALAGKKLGIIHFDAHHDLREAHFGAISSGVPFRKALQFPGQPISPRNLVQIGMTEFCNSPIHAEFAAAQGISVYPGLQVRREGIDRIIDQAIDRATDGVDALYCSVDIDAIDQSQAPGTAAPNACGLDARDVMRAVRRIARHAKTIGVDVVEISPPFDLNNMTGNVGAQLVLNMLAGLALR